MEPESQERFEKIDLKTLEIDERLVAHDKQLLAIRNLLHTGMRMLVDIEAKFVALADSDGRLYGAMNKLDGALQELAEAQKRTAEAQRKTEESLKRFLDR